MTKEYEIGYLVPGLRRSETGFLRVAASDEAAAKRQAVALLRRTDPSKTVIVTACRRAA